MVNQDSKSINTGLGHKNSAASVTKIIFPSGVTKKYVDAKFDQHAECARMHGSQMNRITVVLCRPVRPDQQPCQTEFLGFGRSFERDKYHAYVMEDD